MYRCGLGCVRKEDRKRCQTPRPELYSLQLVLRAQPANGKIVVADLDNCTDEELTKLAASEVGRRKTAVAQEILRRRPQERWQQWLDRHAALAGVIKPVMRSLVAIRSLLFGKRE